MPYPNQFSQPYQYQYPPQVPAPMDRLAQLQAQQLQAQQYPPQAPQSIQQPQTTQSWAYVQGEAAAKSWLIANGQSVLLMDSEAPVFYIKSTDNSGIPLPLRVFDYKERTQATPQNASQAPQSEQTNLDDKYVTRAEYDDLNGKYIEILNRLDSFLVGNVSTENGSKPTQAANKSRNRGGNADE